MPCDPYTELEYFHTIARMVECVEKNIVDMIKNGEELGWFDGRGAFSENGGNERFYALTLSEESGFSELPPVLPPLFVGPQAITPKIPLQNCLWKKKIRSAIVAKLCVL